MGLGDGVGGKEEEEVGYGSHFSLIRDFGLDVMVKVVTIKVVMMVGGLWCWKKDDSGGDKRGWHGDDVEDGDDCCCVGDGGGDGRGGGGVRVM